MLNDRRLTTKTVAFSPMTDSIYSSAGALLRSKGTGGRHLFSLSTKYSVGLGLGFGLAAIARMELL